MAIGFQEIPTDRRQPGAYIEINSSRAVRGLPGMPQKALLIGQHLGGNTPALDPVMIVDPEDAAAAFGRNSMLHGMAEAFRAANDTTELWAVALDDAAGAVASVQSMTFSKSDPAADFGSGTVNLWVGGVRVRAACGPATAPADIVIALIAQAERQDDLPALLSVDAGDSAKLLITARHAGEEAGAIDVRLNLSAVRPI